MKSNNSGIYKITCKITGKFYIGSSNNLRGRKYTHLELGTHNRYLKRAIAKYGKENFTWIILEYCDPKHCLIREQYYLDILLFAREYIESKGKDRRFKKLGYNAAPSAKNNLGYIPSDSTRIKWSKLRKGKILSQETKDKISLAQKNTIKQRGCGYTKGRVISELEKLKRSSRKGKNNAMWGKISENSVKACSKPVNQLDLNGNFIAEFKSIQQASDVLGIIRGCIGNVLIGLSKTGAGFKWEYKKC